MQGKGLPGAQRDLAECKPGRKDVVGRETGLSWAEKPYLTRSPHIREGLDVFTVRPEPVWAPVMHTDPSHPSIHFAERKALVLQLLWLQSEPNLPVEGWRALHDESTAIMGVLLQRGLQEQTLTSRRACKASSRHGSPGVQMLQLKVPGARQPCWQFAHSLLGKTWGCLGNDRMSGTADSEKGMWWGKRRAGASCSPAKLQDGATFPLLTGSWNKIREIHSFRRFGELGEVPRLVLWLRSFTSLKATVDLLAIFMWHGREMMEGRNTAISLVIYPSCMT